MFDFIETGRGIQILYQYAKEEILASDFFDLLKEDYEKLPQSEQAQKWYTLNPAKLNKNYFAEKYVFIVAEKEKNILLKAVEFINATAATLPVTSSFLEKLLYTNRFVPSCFFSDEREKQNNDARIIQLK